jgi:hypothetical protein
LAATNGHILIFKSFVFPENFVPNRPWVILGKDGRKAMDKYLSEDFAKMLSHSGWFKPSFLPLTQILGLKVLGTTPTSPGYMVANSDLIGVVMPATKNDGSCFQFTSCNTSQ